MSSVEVCPGSESRRPLLIVLEHMSRIGGGQRVLLDLLPAMRGEFEVLVAAPGGGDLEREVRQGQVPFHVLPEFQFGHGRKGWRDVFGVLASLGLMYRRLLWLIREHKPVLLVANGGPALLWGSLACLRSGCPILWYNHVKFLDRKTIVLLRFLARRRTVRAIAGTHEASVDQIAPRAKSHVLPAGVDLDKFRMDAGIRRQTRAAFGFRDEQCVVGCFGDLLPVKRQDIFLEAIARAREKIPGAVPLLVGVARGDSANVEFGNVIVRRCGELGGVVREWIPALERYFMALDILVIASETETGPLVLFQALALGVPVVSTRVGRAPELLQDRAFGVLVTGDAGAIATGIVAMHGRLVDGGRLAAEARSVAEKDLDLRASRERYMAVVRGALARGTP